jgi:hypothetical protein
MEIGERLAGGRALIPKNASYRFAPKTSRRPSQSFIKARAGLKPSLYKVSRTCQGMLPSPRVNSTPWLL